MPGLIVPTATGELFINSISMHTPAWCVLDLLPLWAFPATRGGNVIVPGASGQRAYPRRIDETTYSLEMVIVGDVDQSGDPYDNPLVGLQTNLEYLWDNVVSPPDAPTATRPAELDMPDGSTRSDDVQVALELGRHGAHDVLAVLELTVPSGRFGAESGS